MDVQHPGPLTGQNILVTRPKDQAEGLCRLIERAGGTAIRLPLLEIEPVEDSNGPQALLGGHHRLDWLIFISANAVRFGLPLAVRAADGSLPGRVAAVGEATALALAAAGIRVDLIPKPQFNSESLLESPEFAEISGQRIVIVRGQGGREHLAETLRSRGAEVNYAEVYRREPAAPGRIAEIIGNAAIDAVVVTSGEALSHLTESIGAVALPGRCPLIAIASRVAEMARAQGWLHAISAAKASDAAILDALIDALGHVETGTKHPA